MAKVLVYHNFYRPGAKLTFEQSPSKIHKYVVQKLGILFVNPYRTNKKHMSLVEFIKRFSVCVILFWRSFFYDVLILDVQTVGLIMGALLWFRKKPKVLIIHFNLLRRRKGIWLSISRLFFQRIDHFIMHSQFDLEYTSELYRLPLNHFSFYPYTRRIPAMGMPDPKYISEQNIPYILSFGVNARDYKTFLKAVESIDHRIIIVARKHNLEGLVIPDNVRVFYNIPLEELDKLTSMCRFTVFIFDGSELSCGQISIVTSLMLGKPVICTDCTAVSDYVADGINGLLVKLGDAVDLRNKMLKLCSDQLLYDRLSSGAYKWAERYTDPEAIQKYTDDIVSQLVPGK
jgi:glycosyltransferase involved in cell wall biosynthesis